MFTQTWKKYLTVINLLIKKSTQGVQVLNMNNTDFERAAGGRKMKFTFTNIQLLNGRINYLQKPSPFANEFVALLQADETIKQTLQSHQLEFTLSGEFKLTIKNMAVEAATTTTEAEVAKIEDEITTPIEVVEESLVAEV